MTNANARIFRNARILRKIDQSRSVMSLGEFMRSRTAVKLYVFAATLFILFFLFDAWIMPAIVHSRAEIQIPDVSKIPFDKAAEILDAAGLNAIDAGTAPNAKVREGNVLYQNPPAGAIVREGRNVYLTMSGGEQKLVMPNLRGRSLRDAKITLERLELRVGMVAFDISDLPAETVVSQSVPAGRTLKANRSIDLVVSMGKDMKQLDVPYLVGLKIADAQKLLAENGLKLGKVVYKADPDYSPNTIIAQSPSAGDKVDPNMPIDITVVR